MSAKNIKIRANQEAALALEKEGDLDGAYLLYQKVAVADALNEQAWNRSMIILRKQKKAELELKLIKQAISSYKKAIEATQKNWLQANKKKAELTKDLAKTLGLLDSNGLPTLNSEILERWQNRLHLLSHRLSNAKDKANKKTNTKTKKKTARNHASNITHLK